MTSGGDEPPAEAAGRPWLLEKSQWSQNKYFIRPIATFLLNYTLTLDRREFRDEADRLYVGPLSGLLWFFSYFFPFIYSFKTSCD